MEMGKGDDDSDLGSTLSGLAAKIKNIDGRPVMTTLPRRSVKFGNNTVHEYEIPTKLGDEAYDSNLVNEESNVKVDENVAETVNVDDGSLGSNSANQLNVKYNEDLNGNMKGDKADVSSSQKPSFASVVNEEATRKVVFRLMESEKPSNELADVQIPISEVVKANSRFENSLYGYFLGKRVAFPVVQQYVLNSWKRYGLINIMMNAKGFFFFKFNSATGLEGVLENGPWFIRSVPIVLKKWSPNVSLLKEDTNSVPTWIKLFDVPIAAYTEVGLSIIASRLGKPIMLDSYTCTMCTSSWGRLDFARAMIDLRADLPLKDSLVVEIPSEDGSDPTLHTVKVEYEWKPPRCDSCKVFGHADLNCPKNVVVPKNDQSDVREDGFQEVKNRNRGKKLQVNQKQKFVYRPKTSVPSRDPKSNSNASSSKGPGVNTANSFDVLGNAELNEAKEDMGAILKMSSHIEQVKNSAASNKKMDKTSSGNYSGKQTAISSGVQVGGNPKFAEFVDSDGDDVVEVFDEFDYDMHSYLDSQDRSRRKKK